MVEQAKYEVLKQIKNVEIRRYPSLVTARLMVMAMEALTFFSISLQAVIGKNQELL
jgi:hypothetical protein